MDAFTMWAFVFFLVQWLVFTKLAPAKWSAWVGGVLLLVGILGVFVTVTEILSAYMFSCIPIGVGLLWRARPCEQPS